MINWRLRGNNAVNNVQPPALVARQPQRDAAGANVLIAQQKLAKAQLDIAATTITAPFAAIVLERHVHVGEYKTVGAPCCDCLRLIVLRFACHCGNVN